MINIIKYVPWSLLAVGTVGCCAGPGCFGRSQNCFAIEQHCVRSNCCGKCTAAHKFWQYSSDNRASILQSPQTW